MSEGASPGVGEFAVGARVAGYRLDALIGRGGMAAVYRAYDPRLERRVALKILAPGSARDVSFRQRFIRESRAAAAVDHPNIIPIFEAGEAPGHVLFIAMRLVEGRDVQKLIREEGPLPPARACHIAAQVASALDAAHSLNLVHRDVKPANMLRDPAAIESNAEHVYLSDFGISKRLGLSKGSLSSTGLTLQGQFLGTVDYMAPEQIEGRAVDGRADQYALACSLFEMLTGSPPFNQDESLATLWAHLSTAAPALTSRRPGLPAASDEVMATALAKSPDRRYGTCADFVVALRRSVNPLPATVRRSRTVPAAGAAPAHNRPDQALSSPNQAVSRPAEAAGRVPAVMPGGGVARRPLNFIVMADCSGSMKGAKMQALNSALRSMLPHLASWEREQAHAQLLIRVLKFASVPQWHVAEPMAVTKLMAGWRDLESVQQGRTNMGPAFRMVARTLEQDRLERRALRPAILLITDGLPTDPPGEFEAGMAELTGSGAGRSALRLAVAIGPDTNSGHLDRFRSPDAPVLVADSADQIADQLVAASVAVSRISEARADPGAGG